MKRGRWLAKWGGHFYTGCMSLATHSISIVQAKLSEQLCRIESGFFFANDEAIFFSGNPRRGYISSARLSIHTMLAQSTAVWTELDENPNCRLEKEGLIIWGGSTSWEGDGFLAVSHASSGELIWLLHLQGAEAFTEIALENGVMRARSGQYPEIFVWEIPLNSPEALKVVLFHA
ncbi:MAG: hypothetical protein IPL28_01645 [Chloroflexi bacterium]|nr:hypothetical protein [Chloroflexota bacterium]